MKTPTDATGPAVQTKAAQGSAVQRGLSSWLGLSADYRFVRFLLVGATGLVVNNAALAAFTELGNLHYLLSAALATQCSTLWNFLLTEAWVFDGVAARKSFGGRLARFFMMNNLALLLRGPLLTSLVSLAGVHYILANLASIFALSVLRYALSSRWIWSPTFESRSSDHVFYDIHGIIGIESRFPLPELEFFRVAGLDRPPDMRLRLERRKRSRPSATAIRYHDGLGPGGFDLSIEPGECTEIQVSALVQNSPHVLYTNIFEPLLRWAFVRKGYALVHAACVSSGHQGVLVTARTDTGKTSTTLKAIQHYHARFLSDDMTLMAADGTLLPFPKPLTISAHTLNALGRVRLGLMEKLTLQVQSRIHSRSGRKFALWLSRSRLPAASINALVQILVPPPKYDIHRLLPEAEIGHRASLSHILLIERGAEGLAEIEEAEIVQILIRNSEDAYGFPPYPQISKSLSKWKGEDLHHLERAIIQSGVRGCQAYRLRSRTYDWWAQIPTLVDLEPRAPSPTLVVNAFQVSEIEGGIPK